MTATVGIGYGNLIDSSTLATTGWTNVAYLQNRDLAERAESTSSTATLDIDHGSAKSAQVFALLAHTCTDAFATVTVTRGTTSGASDVLSLSAVSCWPFSPLDSDRDGSVFGIWVIAPAATTARYTRIVVAGSATMRFGRAFVGRLFVPEYNPEYRKIADGWMPSLSTVDRMQNGADRVWARRSLRSIAFDYSVLSESEASLFREIQRTHGTTSEVCMVRSTQDRSEQQQHGFLGLMRSLSALEHPFFGRESVAIAIDERGGAP